MIKAFFIFHTYHGTTDTAVYRHLTESLEWNLDFEKSDKEYMYVKRLHAGCISYTFDNHVMLKFPEWRISMDDLLGLYYYVNEYLIEWGVSNITLYMFNKCYL